MQLQTARNMGMGKEEGKEVVLEEEEEEEEEKERERRGGSREGFS